MIDNESRLPGWLVGEIDNPIRSQDSYNTSLDHLIILHVQICKIVSQKINLFVLWSTPPGDVSAVFCRDQW